MASQGNQRMNRRINLLLLLLKVKVEGFIEREKQAFWNLFKIRQKPKVFREAF